MNYFGIYYSLIGICFILASLFIIWNSDERPNFSFLMKFASSIAFTLFGIVNMFFVSTNTLSMLFIVLGLLVSISGDVILAFVFSDKYEKEKVIKTGMVAFSIAQVFYFIGICLFSGFSFWSLVIGLVIATAIMFSDKLLGLDYGTTKPFAVSYSFLLACSLGASLMAFINTGCSKGSIFLFVGFMLFFLSDLVLAFIYFKKNSALLTAINLSLYYIAQIVIAAGVLFLV